MSIVKYLEKEHPTLLGDVRQRLGAEDENDIKYDYKIEGFNAKQIMAKWCGWHLGDEDWGNEIIGRYEELKEELAKVSASPPTNIEE
jgi:hypothetical protein